MPAEGAATIWNPQLRGGQSYTGESDDQGEILDFNIVTFNSGGTGARPNKDGLSATAFPSGVRTMPVEATENAAPVLFRRKEYRPDSGGAGRWRGGLGQVMEIEGKDQQPFNALAQMLHELCHAHAHFGGIGIHIEACVMSVHEHKQEHLG